MNAIQLYRIGNYFHRKKIPFIPKLVQNLIFLVFNSYIPSSATIGANTRFAYGGIGVVIHSDAIIGEGCLLGQGITIGAKEAFASVNANKCPEIGDNCYISAGARIIGDIKIGSSCIVGASSVVTKSFSDNAIIIGVPAKIHGETKDNYKALVY